MGRKLQISKEFIGTLNNGGSAQAVSADYTSQEIHVAQADKGSIYLAWSGGSTPNIDVYIQVRNGTDKQSPWYNLDLGSVPNISGASGSHVIQFSEILFTDMRVFLDRASGSANVSASFTFSSIGA